MIKKQTYLLQIFLCFLLFSCGVNRSTEVIEPLSMPTPREIKNVRVALVLGGGGAKGTAHAGVIEGLEKAGVPIDLIVGCSAGSIVGAMYADKQDYRYLREAFYNTSRNEMLDFSIQNIFHGPVKGHSLEKFMLKHLKHKNLEELTLPTVILTTDLHEGKPIWLSSGPIAPAVVASCALPPVFSPRKLYGKTLVDGGVIEMVPVSYAQKLNAEVIIAVDVSSRLPETLPNHILGVTKRSMEIILRTLSEIQLEKADVVIIPNVDHFGLFEENPKEIYNEGLKTCRAKLPEILNLLKNKGIELNGRGEELVF
jgi:NTE family protein